MPPASVALLCVVRVEPPEPPLESFVVAVVAPPAALVVVPPVASLVVVAFEPPFAALCPPAWLDGDVVPSEPHAATKSVIQRLPVTICNEDIGQIR